MKSHIAELTEPVSLHEAILLMRNRAALTQEKLAQRAKVSVRTVRMIESGDSDPREGTIRQICQALGIPTILLRLMTASEEDRLLVEQVLSDYLFGRRRKFVDHGAGI
ncbi:MAG: helix-turn-helix transcriptional regulator [Planctomycetaceae bacterium]|nr:helix-turn-helix transcriptional regulator [Planctomycetaceae bacterium]